ncbi:hypothetical protein LVJ94_27735 [Pendulispora rubella]|uniref:Uncharacterized protein n=1 Tax=Pendulispora rubella TaxID=2741070 RepID=A0ABZ2KTU6_9BACT
MYIARSDWQHGVAVWWYAGVVSDEEWEETFAHRRELCARSQGMPFRPSVLLVTGTEPMPNALRRRQLCEVQDHPHYNPYIACVNRDPRQPGITTALRWVRGRPNWDESTFLTIDQGIAWLEEKRGGRLPALRLLTANVRRLVAAQAQSRA